VRKRSASAVIVTVGLAVLAVAACERRDEAPPPRQAYAYPPPSYSSPAPTYAYPPQPAPAAAPAMPPAFGFYCQGDADIQCPYARCVGGRCGGCADGSQCKPGAFCAPSPVGMACWPDYRGGNTAPPAAPAPAPMPIPAPSSDPFGPNRQSCVDRINQDRARVRVAPLARDGAAEPCADEEARLDARASAAHGSFGKCGERAQNACPDYPGRSPEDVLAACLQQMFDEGPGGGHFDNVTNTKYSRAFCGFVATGNGRYWILQDFR
jgi:hypothetical protein